MNQGIDINKLQQEAKARWFKAVEVYYILKNYERLKITQKTPVRPPSGSMFLYNRRVLRYFRNDGYQWRKKANGTTIREGHERLKVDGIEALNCYYAHGEQNPLLQRRSYWILDPAFEHIVFVHYREVTEGRSISEQILSNSCDSHPALQQSLTVSDDQMHKFQSNDSEVNEQWQNSSSQGSGASDQSISMHVNEYIRKLEEQLSLDEDNYDKSKEILKTNEQSTELPLARDFSNGLQDLLEQLEQSTDGNEEQAQFEYMLNGSDDSIWCNESHCSLIHASTIDTFEATSYPVVIGSDEAVPITENSDYLPSDFSDLWSHQDAFVVATEMNSDMAPPQGNWLNIWEYSPEWSFTSESTKVIVSGDCVCSSSEKQWTISFGDVEVPLENVRNGVFRCMTPQHSAGKVKVCLTSGKNGPCFEIGEFEFREKLDAPVSDVILQVNESKSTDELLLLVTLVKVLSCANFNVSVPQVNHLDSDLSMKLKETEDTFATVIKEISGGAANAIQTLDFLVQELLKDKLNQLSKSTETIERDNFFSNQEHNIIHIISGLSYQWALEPILCSGIGINFRDSRGWTALHWAAKYGREEMVAALLAAGASAEAVTHPTPDNPTGKTAATIASENGHKGLAGYLSEVYVTSQLFALKTEKPVSLQYSGSIEEDKGVDGMSNRIPHLWGGTEDQLSLRDTLAAVRNTTQAAARIQTAFRAYSFKKKQERALASQLNCDLSAENIFELSLVSKLHDTNNGYLGPKFAKAAVSIQKNYRCWSKRREYLNLRRSVVKIQAHWRAHLARKKYKEMLWTVSILEKVVLRWHRKGDGLRGFRGKQELTDANTDEDDIIKVFRKQKVDTALDDSISKVLSMVDSPEARQQYRRMLERYQYAAAEHSQYRDQNG